MKQLLLDIQTAPPPTLQNFVCGANHELVQMLRLLAERQSSQRVLLVWGASGSGKSHLLRAAVSHAGQQARYLDAPSAQTLDEQQPEPAGWLALDNVQRLEPAAQIALFNLFNRFREQGGHLLLAAPAAPAQLDLRDDLKTRLAWGLVYQVAGLSDAEKTAALLQHAQERGMRLPQEVVEYCLRHLRRDLPSLMATLDALDDWSLTMQKPVTLHLVRQLLRQLLRGAGTPAR